jgi:TonB family protein
MKCLPALACAFVLGGSSGMPAQEPEMLRVYLATDALMPIVANRVNPYYPTPAPATPFSGDIDVETVIGTTGAVIHVRATSPGSGREAFRDEALDAARKWYFRPALLGAGKPLPVLVVLRMTFRAARDKVPAEASARLMPAPRLPPKADLPAVVYQSVPPGGGLVLIRSVKPQYTSQAKERSVQGAVTLNILVMPDGTVGDATVAKSLDRQYGLDDQAILAARYWLFQPAIVDGRPVAFRTTLELEFRMQGDYSDLSATTGSTDVAFRAGR